MTNLKATITAIAMAGGFAAATLGFGAATAIAEPPPPPMPAEAGEVPPTWAPRKPAEEWLGRPIVWTSMWGGRWGVWINGAFMPLTSNVVTNGG